MLVVAVGATIVFRLMDIQWVNGEKWEKVAEENGLRIMRVNATRGNILSDDGSLMATSLPFYKLAIDPTVASDTLFNAYVDTLSVLLATYFLDKTPETYANELREARLAGKRYKLLNKSLVNYHHRELMQQWPIFKEGRLRGGVIFEKVEKRFMPFDGLARRVIGFVREDSANQVKGVGLEYSYHNKLAGMKGEALFQRLPGGEWKPLNDASFLRPRQGFDIQTTINMAMQDHATQVLKSALVKHAANYGTLTIMEVATGEVKAMVNLTRTPRGEYVEDYNYAIGPQGTTEPGSTFKLASFMALLEETDIDLQDTVNTHSGRFEFYEECVMTDPTAYGYGKIPVKSVFEKSSNIGTSRLTFLHFREKPGKFLEYLDRFGLSRPLNFQMLGEGKPYFNRPGEIGWSGCSLPWMSIGYELKISPLQLLMFYNAVANNGKLLAPMVTKRIVQGNKVMEEFDPMVLQESICSEKTAKALQSLLEGVVERGTAREIRTPEYKIAGKTGTAHKIKQGKYVNSYYSSFVGYFPADQPKYSMIVAIDDPQSGVHYGGDVAAPVFRQVADRLFIEIDNQLTEEVQEAVTFPLIRAGYYQDLALLCDAFNLKQLSMNTSKWVRAQTEGDMIQWVDNSTGDGRVPDVRGMTLRDALFVLENLGYTVKSRGKGRVVTQSLTPGSRARAGGVIFISLE